LTEWLLRKRGKGEACVCHAKNVTRAKKEREKEKKEMGGLRSKIPVLKATVVWLAVLSILPAMLLASCVFEAVGKVAPCCAALIKDILPSMCVDGLV